VSHVDDSDKRFPTHKNFFNKTPSPEVLKMKAFCEWNFSRKLFKNHNVYFMYSDFFIKYLYSTNVCRYIGQCFIFVSFSVVNIWYLYGMKGVSRNRTPICSTVLME